MRINKVEFQWSLRRLTATRNPPRTARGLMNAHQLIIQVRHCRRLHQIRCGENFATPQKSIYTNRDNISEYVYRFLTKIRSKHKVYIIEISVSPTIHQIFRLQASVERIRTLCAVQRNADNNNDDDDDERTPVSLCIMRKSAKLSSHFPNRAVHSTANQAIQSRKDGLLSVYYI